MDVTATEMNRASEIVAAFTGDSVHTVTPVIGKGSVNKIVVCETERGERIVVRMSSSEDEGRGVSFYEKERWCIEAAAKRGVPGPTVLTIGRWGTCPYMLQTLVPGINGEDNPLDTRHIWHALGRHAKIIHAIPLDGFGETLDRFHRGDAPERWREFVHYNIRSLTRSDDLLGLQVYAPEQRDTIRRVFEDLLTTPFRFGLNHGDLSPRNTVINADATVYLLDWGSAEAHVVPHYDFLHIVPWNDLQNENFCAFLEGYEMSEATFARMLPELRALLLLKSFDLTRWAIDRCPERTAEIASRANEALRIALLDCSRYAVVWESPTTRSNRENSGT